MRERNPVTQTMKASEARQRWSAILNEVFRGETRVLVEKSGVPVAAIISAEDLERFRRLEEQVGERFRVLEEMRKAFKDQPLEEIEQEVARAIAEVRGERREEQRSAQTA